MRIAYPDLQGCQQLAANSTDAEGRPYRGSIMLIRRGSCGFGSKSLAAQNAGAVGVIIFSCAPPLCPADFSDMSGTQNVSIPSVMIRYGTGQTLYDEIRSDPARETNITIEGTGPIDPADWAALKLMMQQNSNVLPDPFGGGTRPWPSLITGPDQYLDPCMNRVSGIWCIRGRVWAIKMVFLEYTGPVPAAIGQLSELRELVLGTPIFCVVEAARPFLATTD